MRTDTLVRGWPGCPTNSISVMNSGLAGNGIDSPGGEFPSDPRYAVGLPSGGSDSGVTRGSCEEAQAGASPTL